MKIKSKHQKLTSWCQSINITEKLTLGNTRISHQTHVDASYEPKKNCNNKRGYVASNGNDQEGTCLIFYPSTHKKLKRK